jgi:hypothetical protein
MALQQEEHASWPSKRQIATSAPGVAAKITGEFILVGSAKPPLHVGNAANQHTRA